MLKLVVALWLAGALGTDVMPGCGSRRHQLRDVAPGEFCGGPARCLEATACFELDQSLTRRSGTSSYVCTKACSSDADCNGLSVKLRCTGSGKPIGGSARQSVCLPIPDPPPPPP